MKKLMTGAMALALLASADVSVAQEREYNPALRRGGQNVPDRDRPRPAQPAPVAPPAAQAPVAPQARGDEHRGDRGRGDWNRGDRGDRDGRDGRDRGDRDGRDGRDWNGRGDDRRRDDNDRGRDGRGWNDGRNWQDSRHWDDPRRHQPRPRYDRRRYDPIWRSQERYRGWVYRPPAGFYARSWVFGDIVPRTWWGPDYRIMDWWSYGLPIPPAGYEWVRVGDDALLVDMYSGRVVQVAYDLFW